MDAFFEDDFYKKIQKHLAKALFKILEKEGDVDLKKCATKIIICQEGLKQPLQALHTSISFTPLKSQRTNLNALGFTQSVISSYEVKRQRLERKKKAEE